MILSAALLTTLQRCARRYRLETGFKVLRMRPKELFDRLLREAVFQISNGADVQKVTEEACTQFLEAAAQPGLEVICDPYTIAADYCVMLRTTLEKISRMVLLTLKRGGKVKGDHHDWLLASFVDESGLLHRWTSVERWDNDAMYRELHSWHVFGDCAAANIGMVLHVVEIGRQIGGHQHSHWCRSFKHPAIHNHFKFQKTEGGRLEPSWKPVFYVDSPKNNPKAWVDAMDEDKVELIRHVHIKEPRESYVAEFWRDANAEGARAFAVPGNWQDVPKFRPACDVPPCPWEAACHTPGLVNIETVGGFAKLTS